MKNPNNLLLIIITSSHTVFVNSKQVSEARGIINTKKVIAGVGSRKTEKQGKGYSLSQEMSQKFRD